MQEDDKTLYGIAMLIEELKNDEVQVRLNSMRRLQDIAKALGEQRTRDELLPFLQISIDDEDEVLFVLAEQLGNFLPLVGGPKNASSLLTTLESIAVIQEATVRDEAVKSLVKIGEQFPSEDIENYFVPLVRRLANNEWFTAKMSACGLLPHIYKHCCPDTKTLLRHVFTDLYKDPVPMVKRAATASFDIFISAIEPEFACSEFFQDFNTLSHDDQDSVRILIIKSCIAYLHILTEGEVLTSLLPIIEALAEDVSWRVRWSVAADMHTLCSLVTPAVIPSFVEIFIKLLRDSEGEVKAAAASHITDVCKYIEKESIIGNVYEVVKQLSEDPNEHVRAALAKDILGLCPLLEKEYTTTYMLPLFVTLLNDTSSDVRLLILSHLDLITSMVDIDTITENILTCIYTLSTDKKWRVRLAILNYFPVLAEHLKQEFFDTHLLPIMEEMLSDNVCEIRETCCVFFKKLRDLYGNEYIINKILPVIQKMENSEKYLYRITGLHALAILAEDMPAEFIETYIVPLAILQENDVVANVRFNVAKVLGTVSPLVSVNYYNDHIYPVLEKLMTDPDVDVSVIAQGSLMA